MKLGIATCPLCLKERLFTVDGRLVEHWPQRGDCTYRCPWSNEPHDAEPPEPEWAKKSKTIPSLRDPNHPSRKPKDRQA